MEQTWRWYGPNDPVQLPDIRQAGAAGVVSDLHQIPNGVLWAEESIFELKKCIENSGLTWTIVESIPVHENIKTRTGNFQVYIESYKKSIENLANNGIYVVCYNFMAVLDWTRTDLGFQVSSGAKALRFDVIAFAAFEFFLLKRSNAEKDYSVAQYKAAKIYIDALSEESKIKLIDNIITGLPGAEEGYTLEQFQTILDTYKDIDASVLINNLVLFLKEIIPIASKNEVLMCIHPDDPSYSILGLPRVVSTEEDYAYLFENIPDKANGITFCTGSLGVRVDDNLVRIFNRFAGRAHFLHLRSTKRDEQGNFYKANHLEGDVDMYNYSESNFRRRKQAKNRRTYRFFYSCKTRSWTSNA